MLRPARHRSGVSSELRIAAELGLNIIHRSPSVVLRLHLLEDGALPRSDAAVDLALDSEVVTVYLLSHGLRHGPIPFTDLAVEPVALVAQLLHLLFAPNGILLLVVKALGPARVHPAAHPVGRLDEVGLRRVSEVRGLSVVPDHAR